MLDSPTLKNLTKKDLGKPAKTQNALLQRLGQPHTSSFNFMVNEGLALAISDIQPCEFMLHADRIKLWFDDGSISCPLVPFGSVGVTNQRILPSECRQRAATYRGKLRVRLRWSINDIEQQSIDKDMGQVPIMVKSNRCHLDNMQPKQLVKHGEHEQEWGGYFVVKGHERLIRMLLMTRRNYPVAIKRSGWKQRGALFSEYGVVVRSVSRDETSTNNVLHFVTDGTAKFMFGCNKVLYYLPLVLLMKCLSDYCDRYIFQKLIQGYEEDSYYVDCVKKMLRAVHEENLHTSDECKSYLGKMFRVKMYECPKWWTDTQMADYIMTKYVFIHLNNNDDKFNLLVFMTQKLFVFAQERCKAEGADAVMMQELLLGGHLYLQVVKEKLSAWLNFARTAILRSASTNINFTLTQSQMLAIGKRLGGLEHALEVFLATGNIQSSSGLGMMQDKGLTIVAENINRMRYMSHFRSVHRGAFFQEMRTTEVRQLLPDAWGFICPVHTPDGSPCGLLNHLTMNCVVTEAPDLKQVEKIPVILAELGMLPLSSLVNFNSKLMYPVQLDGKIVGYVPKKLARKLVDNLRNFKVREEIPKSLEIVLVPIKENITTAQFPGIFLFTGPARMMRPLLNLSAQKIELIGTFEQIYLDICVTPSEFYSGVTTHMEPSKLSFLSNLAQLIPMPDCNQSPRNMYQCQMGKQTMGTPCHNWSRQSETKMYRLQTPASPLFRPVHYDNIGLDEFPMGTNAIVAVISYTGYDMEDAMIINKAADERGFAHGSIYKTQFVELDHVSSYFCRDPHNDTLAEFMDSDGLPYIGRRIRFEEPIYCYFNFDNSEYVARKSHSKEDLIVDHVKMCTSFERLAKKTACIVYRIERNPSVGDKFASRAGQKGICSQKWPMEDLPFTESGLVPDIVFNPHGFPSRMTIAMMIEVMAGKSGAIHGLVHDATPFKFSEEDTAIDYFGRLLEQAGYNYYGLETMYSGIDGREMNAQIFFGVVHYQRLRHMVSDKWQVRSTGPIDLLTRQPLKGRKRGGGVRFGEMERDALIAHGASFLLQDRLFHGSDKTKAFICTVCGSLLGPVTVCVDGGRVDKTHLMTTREECRLCGNGDGIAEIQIPYIFKFFVTQMASCNINVKLECEKV